jgi:putative addiction module CopG family antidote
MTIQMPADVEANIRRRIASGRYESEADVLRDALDALDRREHERFLLLRAKVRAGFEAAEQGDLVDVTPELFDELEREADELARQGYLPNPDVCP